MGGACERCGKRQPCCHAALASARLLNCRSAPSAAAAPPQSQASARVKQVSSGRQARTSRESARPRAGAGSSRARLRGAHPSPRRRSASVLPCSAARLYSISATGPAPGPASMERGVLAEGGLACLKACAATAQLHAQTRTHAHARAPTLAAVAQHPRRAAQHPTSPRFKNDVGPVNCSGRKPAPAPTLVDVALAQHPGRVALAQLHPHLRGLEVVGQSPLVLARLEVLIRLLLRNT